MPCGSPPCLQVFWHNISYQPLITYLILESTCSHPGQVGGSIQDGTRSRDAWPLAPAEEPMRGGEFHDQGDTKGIVKGH